MHIVNVLAWNDVIRCHWVKSNVGIACIVTKRYIKFWLRLINLPRDIYGRYNYIFWYIKTIGHANRVTDVKMEPLY
jgi:hypothetical protein